MEKKTAFYRIFKFIDNRSFAGVMDSKKLSAFILINLSKSLRQYQPPNFAKEIEWCRRISGNGQMVWKLSNWMCLAGPYWFIFIPAFPINYSVPQGAILSSLLFCTYTKDFPTVAQTSELNSFVHIPKYRCHFPSKKCLRLNKGMSWTFDLWPNVVLKMHY